MTAPDKHCPLCGEKVINWGAHAERCYGRVAKISRPEPREPLCDCHGAWHLPDCPISYWPPKDAA